MRFKTHSVSSIRCHLLIQVDLINLYVNLVLLVLILVLLSDSSCLSGDNFGRLQRRQDWRSFYNNRYQIPRWTPPPRKAWINYGNRQSSSKFKNQLFQSRNSEQKFNPCETPRRVLNQIEEAIIDTFPLNKNYEKLYNRRKQWRMLYQNCVFKKRLSENDAFIRRRQEELQEAPPTNLETNTNGLLVVTGIGTLITTSLLWFLLAARRPHHRPKTRRITQQLHIHPILGEAGESHKEKESEESDLKKAAVGIGLATEIVAINAESIHLAAHIIEFLHILTKIARALPPGNPAEKSDGIAPPPPPPPGQLFTPQQALEFLQYLENNYSSSKIFKGINNSGFKNPLGFLGGGHISASTVFKNAINNPAASVALKKLLAPFNLKENENIVSSGNSTSVKLKPVSVVSSAITSATKKAASAIKKIKPISYITETLLKPKANANLDSELKSESESKLCIILPTTCHVILGTKKL